MVKRSKGLVRLSAVKSSSSAIPEMELELEEAERGIEPEEEEGDEDKV